MAIKYYSGINLAGNIIPSLDSSYNVGAENLRFENVYADNLYGDGSNITNISADAANSVTYTVKNSSGSTINKGAAVMAVGTDGNSGHILIDEMVADGSVEPKYFMGVLESTLANGDIGRVIHFGELRQFNTTAFQNGDVLWCDPTNPGGFTTTEPEGPNLKIAAAIVISSATNGKIKVRVQGNEGLHELHDVKITTQADGEILVWDNTTGVWKNDGTLTVDYTDGRVGIGTVDPTYKLDVQGGDIRFVNDNPLLRIQDNNSDFRYAGISMQTNGGNWHISNGASTDTSESHLFITRTLDGSDRRFVFHRDNYYFGVYDNTNTIKAVINSSGDSYFAGGNLAIGTTSTSYKLHVAGNALITSNLDIGPSSVAGGRVIAQNYSGDHRLGVISSMYASGNLLIGYGIEGNSGTNGYVSTYGNFSGRHGGLEIYSKGFKYVGDTENSQTTIGNTVSVTEFFNLDEGNLTISGDLSALDGSFSNNLSVTGDLSINGDTLFVDASGDNVGIGAGTNTNAKLRVYDTDSDPDKSAYGILVQGNYSGNKVDATDIAKRGVYVDIDSSASGDTVNEHQLFGIQGDVRYSGLADNVAAIYGYAESNLTTQTATYLRGGYFAAASDISDSTGKILEIRGVDSYVDIQNVGQFNSAYGIHGKVNINPNRNADLGATYGGYFEVEINNPNANSYSSIFGVRSIIDNNEGNTPSVGNSYLFYGDYQGTKPGSSSWGIYVQGDKHYLEGQLGIGTANPGTHGLSVVGTGNFTDTVTITSDFPGLSLRSDTNGFGVGINFSDQLTEGQQGNIVYYHADGASYGGDNAFVINSNQANLTVLADGKLMFKDGLYTKPSSGTGTGEKIIDSVGNMFLFGSAPSVNSTSNASSYIRLTSKAKKSDGTDISGYFEIKSDYSNIANEQNRLSITGDGNDNINISGVVATTISGTLYVDQIGAALGGEVGHIYAEDLTVTQTLSANSFNSGSSYKILGTDVISANRDFIGRFLYSEANNGGLLEFKRNDSAIIADETLGQLVFYGKNTGGTYGSAGRIKMIADDTWDNGFKKNSRLEVWTHNDTTEVQRLIVDTSTFDIRNSGLSISGTERIEIDGDATLKNLSLSGNVTFGQGNKIIFPDNASVPDSPTNEQVDYITFGSNGSISQVSGRGALMITSSDDSLVLANGDVGRFFTNTNINVTGETTYLLSDAAIEMYSDLQDGWDGEPTPWYRLRYFGGQLTTWNGEGSPSTYWSSTDDAEFNSITTGGTLTANNIVTTSGEVETPKRKRFYVNLGPVADRWYKIANVNRGNSGISIRGAINNHVENFGTQRVDLTIFGREGGANNNIEVVGRFEVAHQGVGIRVIPAGLNGSYQTYDVYIRTTQYSQAELDIYIEGDQSFVTWFGQNTYVTTEPTGGTPEFDNTATTQGSYVVEDSLIKEVATEDWVTSNTTLQAVTDNGNTTTNDITANHFFADTHFRSTDTAATLSTTGAGIVYLRPNGYNQTSGQAYLSSNGILTLSDRIVTGGAGLVTSGNGSKWIQLGDGRTDNNYAYIDLVGDQTYTDYGLRIIRTNGGENTSSQILHRGTGDLQITTQEEAPILLKTNGSTRLYVSSGGNVGINETSPSAKLHVGGDVIFGQKRIVNLPAFYMGSGGITDEYLVICKQAPSGSGASVSGIQGRIVFSRGSSGAYNNSHYFDINVQMSLDNGGVNNLDINQFEVVTDQTVLHAFTQIEEIDISGTKYIALRARHSGGGHSNHFYFEGSISDDGADTNILSRVRASDANVTVTSPQPSGYPITPYIVKNNSGNIGIGVSPTYTLDVNSGGSDSVARFTSTDQRARILIEDDTDISYFGTYIGTTFIGSDDTPSGNTLNVDSSGNVGVGITSTDRKLDVGGSIRAGGKTTYTKSFSSLDTNGSIVAGLKTALNGASALFTFTCYGHSGKYQRVVVSCYNSNGNWYPNIVVDEGTNDFEITHTAGGGTTVSFTFKARGSGTTVKSYTPTVLVEHVGAELDTNLL